jgi:DNA-binding transcriptional MerR regulator
MIDKKLFLLYTLYSESGGYMGANLYLIKDLSRLSGYSIHTIKYYLRIGLLKEKARSPETGFRFFDDQSVVHLEKIRVLRRQGRPIKQIKDELL